MQLSYACITGYLYQSKDRILQLSLSTNNGTFRV